MSGQCKHCGYDGCVCDNDEQTMNDTPITESEQWGFDCNKAANEYADLMGYAKGCNERFLVLSSFISGYAHEKTKISEARSLAERYRNLSCDSQEEADETLLPWEITTPNEL